MSRLRRIPIGTRLLAASLVFLLAAGIAFFLAFHANQVAGCERGAADRNDNAQGWRAAEAARRAAYSRDRMSSDLAAAAKYDRIASSLESRTRPTAAGRTRYCRDRYSLL